MSKATKAATAKNKKPSKKKGAKKKTTLSLPAAVSGAEGLLQGQLSTVLHQAEERLREPPTLTAAEAEARILDRLWAVVEERRRSGDVEHSHSARLLARGTAKVAQKLGEEAVECVIAAVARERHALIMESADVLYHLIVTWVDAGIAPAEVWAELARRQGISGLAEKAKRQQPILRAAGTKKLP